MTTSVTIGSKVQVKIVKRPTNAAAIKTLVRLLSKDPAAKAETKRLTRAKQNARRLTQRGGRVWEVNAVKQHPFKGAIGESGTIVATADVLTDLQSVSRFVEVSPA